MLADPRCAAADEIVVLGDVVAGTFPRRVLRSAGRARTEYDVIAATEAVLTSSQPSAQEVAKVLLHPPSPQEATAVLEQWRIEAAGAA